MYPLMIWILLVVSNNAIPPDSVRVACERNKTLPFCDYYFSGKQTKSSVTRDKVNNDVEIPSTVRKYMGFNQETRDQFITWLKDFKDVVDIEDTEELETSRRVHSNPSVYCSKYKNNYNSYCSDDHSEELEGVLSQFCTTFKKTCQTITTKTEENFPEPGPLLTNIFNKHSITEMENNTDTFKGTASEYCAKFSSNFDKLCTPDKPLRNSKKEEEFCTSFRENCKAESIFSVKGSATVDEIEEPPSELTNNVSPVGGGGGGGGDNQVTIYCNQYSENYNYYCAGETSTENEKFCKSFRTNCPQKVGSLKESGSFLGGREKISDSEESRTVDSLYLYKGTREEYCSKFLVNYEYYCRGESANAEITAKFCPSYKNGCLDRLSGNVPSSPFTKSVSISPPKNNGDSNFPDVENYDKSVHKHHKGRRPTTKKSKRACTGDCDQRIFKHCTQECKCDYAYPYVQKFCNPPPLPLFLNTCRLWYNGCPKYERYHYASQFIYSKAEKGKKVELPVNSRPFSVVSPNGERIPVVVRQPGITTIARDDPLLDLTNWETPIFLNSENFDARSQEEQKNSTKKNINSARLDAKPPDPFSIKNLPGVSRLPKQLKEFIPQIDLHLDSYPDKYKSYSDDSSRSDPVPSIPKDGKSKDIPVVPSDSVFANAISQYGAYSALTDSSGILHRPRSRSPFTKPGLWEPNPDDPHNRDHANKWFYYPESVNVDWLSGQIAWGAHWAVPAAGVGGTSGYSTVHFPTIGTFLNIPDDYD